MARTTLPLNATQVSQAKTRDKVYNLADGHGLYLRVKPNGTKLWIFNYHKPYTKKRTDISIGQFPAVSLASARQKRSEFLTLLSENIDPKVHREEIYNQKAAAAENTFEVVAHQWLAIHRSKVQEKTAQRIKRSLEKHVFPRVGKIPIGEISAPKAITILQEITGREQYEAAKLVTQYMNNVMTHAVNAGLIHHNPLSGIRHMIPAYRARNMPTINPDELPELMRALNFANIMFATRCLIEWQLHTMVRPGEAATAMWQEIDFKNKLWRIPQQKMKMGREHVVPLTEQSLAILTLMKPHSFHRPYIFPSHRNPKSHASKESANTALKRMGFKDRLVAHGLRALASTTLNEQAVDKDVIEAALAHGDPDKVRGAYNRATYLERRRKMMEWWSCHIEKAANGNMSLLNATK